MFDVNFWSDEKHWPYDQTGYAFVIRAVREFGRFLCGDAWTGREYLERRLAPLPLWQNANGGDRQRAAALLRSHPDAPQSKPVPNDAYSGLRPIRVKHGALPEWHSFREQYEAAIDISFKLHMDSAKVAHRLEAVLEKMVSWLRSGQLVSALRPQPGGTIGHPAPPEFWHTERWRPRFYRGLLNPRDRFGTSLDGPNHHWIFLTRESMDRVIRPSSAAVAPEEVSVEQQTTGRGRPIGAFGVKQCDADDDILKLARQKCEADGDLSWRRALLQSRDQLKILPLRSYTDERLYNRRKADRLPRSDE